MLSSYSKLSIAIIVYYGLALPLAIYVCIKQGFGRHAGWLYLLSMAIVRIVGAALRIAADQHPSVGLYVAASVFSSIGLVPLILCLMGLVKRVNDGKDLGSIRIPAKAFQFTHIITLVGLILAIVAGSESTSTQPSTLNNVRSERKAGAILLLVSALINSALVLFLISRVQHIIPGDRVIIWCAFFSIPFLLARVIYLMLVAFDYQSPDFSNYIAINIWVESFLQIFMEMIVFGLYLAAGLLAPRTTREEHPYGRGIELGPVARRVQERKQYDDRYRREYGNDQEEGVMRR